MSPSVENSLGTVTINESVYADIAGSAVSSCFGVIGMASKKASDGWAEFFGKEKIDKGVVLEKVDDKIKLTLYIVVKYGNPINVIAENVISNVRYSIEDITGIKVTDINVVIADIEM